MAPESLEDVYSSIKAGLDMLKHSAAPTPDVPSKQALVQAAEQIKGDAAKIGLMCSGSTIPQDQLLSLAGGLQQSCVAFCSIVHTLTAAAGPTLKGDLVKLAQGLTNPCLVLVKEMASGKDLKTHVGAVWAGVAAVSKGPADNKACLFKHLASVLNVLQDTSRELEELQQQQQKQFGDAAAAGSEQESGAAAYGSSSSQQSATAAAAAGDAGDDDSGSLDPDLDYEAEEMSALERQLLSSCLQLLEASASVVKAFGKALLQGPPLLLGTDVLDSWESCLFHARHLRRQAEDLGASMYPPQDVAEVASASLAVFEVTELMLDECPDADVVGQEQLSSLSSRLTAAHEHVQQLLATSHDADHADTEADAAAAEGQAD